MRAGGARHVALTASKRFVRSRPHVGQYAGEGMRAKAGRAGEVVMPLKDEDYGSWGFSVGDPGQRLNTGSYGLRKAS
jgi:hypothetical protein